MKTKLYFLKYKIGNKVMEELLRDNPRPEQVCKWWIKQLQKSTHKDGHFVFVEVENN